jgi:hypothetical protein
MSRTTTALVVPELNGKFELREVYLDEMQPDEVLVEIHASGVCHTDLSFAVGLLPCEPNAVLGHEGTYPTYTAPPLPKPTPISHSPHKATNKQLTPKYTRRRHSPRHRLSRNTRLPG